MHLCSVAVVLNVDAELDEDEVDDVGQAEDVIISQWREISADEKHELHASVDEILRPLGYETSLLVIRRANSIAMLFTCLTLSAVMGMRDRWRSRQLRDILQKLFSVLSGVIGTVHIKRLVWPVTHYQRCVHFFDCVQGRQTIFSNIDCHEYMLLMYISHSSITRRGH